jgi:predicted nucleic acid-binding protein
VARKNLVDAGPIIALLVPKDEHHRWAGELWAQLQPPFWTCEAVLSEAQLLVRRWGSDPIIILEMVRAGAIVIDFRMAEEVERLTALQRSYADVPMSLADACLVRMTELHADSRVLTADSDFRLYRRNGRQVIPLLAPEGI